jgi:hypothetical protein
MLSLPEEEGNKLIYYFLAECEFNVTQALSDNLGSEKVSRLWEPYSLLSSRAYVLNRLQENRFPGLLDNKDPLLTIGVFHQHFIRTVLGGRCENMIITDRSLSYNYDMQPADILPVLLETVFHYSPGISQIIDSQYVETSQPIASRTGVLQGLVKKKDDSATTIGNEGSPRLCILPLRIDPSEMDFWQRHFWGEGWRISSGILLEEFGEEKASYIIEPYMKQIGHFYGDYLKNRFELKNKNPQEVGGIVHLLNRLLKQDSKVIKDVENIISCEITSCPFSKSSPFICKQMSMIYNSLCQIINKDILFEYNNGLMKGEKSCHWVIKKK